MAQIGGLARSGEGQAAPPGIGSPGLVSALAAASVVGLPLDTVGVSRQPVITERQLLEGLLRLDTLGEVGLSQAFGDLQAEVLCLVP